MADGTKEYHLEDHIEKFLISSPQSEYGIKHHLFREAEYKTVAPTEYDKDRCLIPSELIAFLRKTQPTEYDKLIEALGSESKAEKLHSIFSTQAFKTPSHIQQKMVK